MIIRGLKLRNFKSYPSLDMRFEDGTTIILGENGVGKSSILEAITYALFRKSTISQKELIRLGCKDMAVEMTFMEKGNIYKVIRSNGKSGSKLYQRNGDEFILLVEGVKETNNAITSILNTNLDSYLNAIYIRQGQIVNLIEKSPSERKKLISKFLQIEDLEIVWSKMPKIINDYLLQLERLEGILQQREQIRSSLQLDKETLKSLSSELTRLNKNKLDCQSELERVKEELKSFEKSKEEYISLKESLKSGERDVQRIDSEVKQLFIQQEGVHEIEVKVKELESLIGENGDRNYDEDISGFQSMIGLLEGEMKSLKKSLKDLDDVDDRCPICQSPLPSERKEDLRSTYIYQIKDKQEQIKNNELELKDLIDKSKQFHNLQLKHAKLKAKLDEGVNLQGMIDERNNMLIKIRKKLQTDKDIIQTLNWNQEKYDRLMKEHDGIEKELQHHIEKTGILKGRIRTLSHNIQQYEEKLESMKKVQAELENHKDYIHLLEECRQTYGKEGVQLDIRKQSREIIERNTNHFFDKFNLDYSNIELDDDYNINICRGDQSLTDSMISGGERVAVALALRMGITRTIAGSGIDCMFLDEPTVHLDDVRVDELIGLFKGLTDIPQLIIVTHNPHLEVLADNVVRVCKRNGASSLVE